MHDDVGAEFERAQEHRGREGRVDAEGEPVVLGDGGHGFDIGDLEQRVGRGLDPEHLGLGPDRLAHGLGLGGIDVGESEAITRQHLVEVPRGAAVDVVRADHVIARGQQLHAGVDRRHAARIADPVFAALDRGQIVLQHLAGRVGRAGVVEAPVLADFLEHVGRGLVDRRHDGAGRGIGRDPGAHHRCVEAQGGVGLQGLIGGHGGNSFG
jgi:hypothetical protein